jgi:hypothetical protein
MISSTLRIGLAYPGKNFPRQGKGAGWEKSSPDLVAGQRGERSAQIVSTARAAPSLLNRSYRVTAEIEVPQGLANGVRLTMDLGKSIITSASLQALHEELMRRQIRGTNA